MSHNLLRFIERRTDNVIIIIVDGCKSARIEYCIFILDIISNLDYHLNLEIFLRIR